MSPQFVIADFRATTILAKSKNNTRKESAKILNRRRLKKVCLFINFKRALHLIHKHMLSVLHMLESFSVKWDLS
uniref:Uncharacterized protein n=1 Tax=Rhizophora mucronata TaxID=61149 RepID=A0A2P2JN74_RHIMU